MPYIFLIGRLIYGGYFFYSAVSGHFMKRGMLSNYAGSKGVIAPKLAVLFSGLLIFFGGLGIILGVYTQWAILAIILFLLPVTFTMHSYWKDADPNAKTSNRNSFMKNMALLGAALMFLAIPTPWMYSAF